MSEENTQDAETKDNTDVDVDGAKTQDATLLTDKKEAEQETEDKDKSEKTPDKSEESEITIPDGMELDTERFEKFKGILEDVDITHDKKQELMDLASDFTQNIAQKQADVWSDIRKGWVEDITADKEFGGSNLDKSLVISKRALKQFGGDPDEKTGVLPIMKVLEETGMGDNPDVIRFLTRVGKAMSEDTLETGSPKNPEQDFAKALYPNTDFGG